MIVEPQRYWVKDREVSQKQVLGHAALTPVVARVCDQSPGFDE